jgi:hypothetical protein
LYLTKTQKVYLITLIIGSCIFETTSRAEAISPLQRRIVEAGNELLESLEVSYVYGGSKFDDPKACDACNICLEEYQPAPKQRLTKCPACKACSMDCSHFTQLVYARAGLKHPYLTSVELAELSGADLKRRYSLVDAGTQAALAQVGDLAVYRGHVVIVEKIHKPGFADIVHATGGKDLKGPGQGIQRERSVALESFRGGMLRLVRHQSVAKDSTDIRKLRPIPKRSL